MEKTLRKISLKRMIANKGKNLSIIFALFLTMFLLIVLFSSITFINDALNEISRGHESWMGDAAFVVTEEEFQAIKHNRQISSFTYGYYLGEILNAQGYMDIELVYYEDQLAYWMNCYPVIGRMPKKNKEIVVSDDFLEDRGLEWKDGLKLNISFNIDGVVRDGEWTLVGVYERNVHSKNVMLFSKDYYDDMKEWLKHQSKNSQELLYKTIHLQYKKGVDIVEASHAIMEDVNFDKSQGYLINDQISSKDSYDSTMYVIMAIFIIFVMLLGYLFISNIFSITIENDMKFYGKLLTLGIKKDEFRQMITFQNNVLFFAAAMPSLILGFVFTKYYLPIALGSFFTFQVTSKTQVFVFVWAIVFSYITLILSSRKQIKRTKEISPIGIKRGAFNRQPVQKTNNRHFLVKLLIRRLQENKGMVIKIYVVIALSYVLASLFYTIVSGFDEKAFLTSNLKADYILTDKTFYSEIDNRNRKTISNKQIQEYRELEGLNFAGGASVTGARINMNNMQTMMYESIIGENNLNYDTSGEMFTNIYGLDEIMLEKMHLIAGEVMVEKLLSGQYVVVGTLEGHRTCFEVGDEIVIESIKGQTKKYEVLAIAELPYELSYQSKWMGSTDVYLPYDEWQEFTGLSDYYMYIFDVEKAFHPLWDKAMADRIKNDSTMTYTSATTILDESEILITEVKIVGYVLATILFCMGLLNFSNCMVSGIYDRKRSFALLESMGVKSKEIIKLLIAEGIVYMVGGIILGIIISPFLIAWMIDGILVFYSVYYVNHISITLLYLCIGLLVAYTLPYAIYKELNRKKSFLFRINEER